MVCSTVGFRSAGLGGAHPEFSKNIRVQVWVGDHYEEQWRVGGIQKIDGFSRVSDVLLEDVPSTL